MPMFTKEQIERAAANGISKNMLYNRKRLGWDIEKAITTPKISPSDAGRMSKAKQPRWNIKN
jgi:hypothetical protein